MGELFLRLISSAVRRPSSPNPPETVFHYTTAEGLYGIVESGQLWATDARYLNDSSEVEYGREVLESVLRRWVQQNSGDRSFGAALLRRLFETCNGPRATERSSIFVVCFCEKPSLLGQWRAYSQTGGYSIGFSCTPSMEQQFSRPAESCEMKFVKVIYERKTQEEILWQLITAILNAANAPEFADQFAQLPPARKESLIDVNSFILHESLERTIAGLKNEAFAEEREWRLIIRENLVFVSMEDPPAENRPKLAYRISRGLLIPYVKLVPSNGPLLSLRSVRSGPTLDRTRAELSVKAFLENHGYKDLKFEGADIPVLL